MRRLLALTVLIVVVSPPQARAHPLGQKPVLHVRPTDEAVGVLWVIARDEARILAEHLELGPIRLEAMGDFAAFRTYVLDRMRVGMDGRGCEGTILPVQAVATGFGVQATYACPIDGERLRLNVTLLHDIDERYLTLYQVVVGGQLESGALTATSPVAEIDLRAVQAVEPTAEPTPSEPPRALLSKITASLEGRAGAAPLVLALLFALALGALHALTPGHGKTLTAAYLVGAGGTVRQGLMLGGIVAGAHALGTATLGAAAIAADRLLLPAQVGPWLEVATGVLILAVAVTLVRARPHVHDDVPVPGRARLAAVGLIGGLVPSPDALAVVLVAFSLERWTAGAALIAAFSIGLAIVVLAVAVLAARGGHAIRRAAGERFVRYAPRAVAVVFFILGGVVLANGIAKV